MWSFESVFYINNTFDDDFMDTINFTYVVTFQMTVFAICKPMKCQPKCMICHKVFKTWIKLTKHSKDEHEQQKEFECTMCGKKQTTASGHRKHMILH